MTLDENKVKSYYWNLDCRTDDYVLNLQRDRLIDFESRVLDFILNERGLVSAIKEDSELAYMLSEPARTIKPPGKVARFILISGNIFIWIFGVFAVLIVVFGPLFISLKLNCTKGYTTLTFVTPGFKCETICDGKLSYSGKGNVAVCHLP